MVTKQTTKTVSSQPRKRPTASSDAKPAKATRPRLHISHGNSASAGRNVPPQQAEHLGKEPSLPLPQRARDHIKAPPTEQGSNGVRIAITVAETALDRKADNVEIIDLIGKADYTDYLVLMTGGSDRHVRGIADAIQEQLLKLDIKPISVEGVAAGSWILIDYGSVVAHIFQEGERAIYDIEGLWLDASRVPIPE